MAEVIKVDNVSIRYITGDFKNIGLKEYVIRKLTGNYHVTEFWADKNVSFTLNHGDMLGIVGTNGAGKSTLLKAIAGIMIPTEGKVRTTGTIAALLELTSGFDSELTVRENIFLRGAMLGYTREFMNLRYDEIIDFSGLADFQDYCFKHLSSGMKSRIAFSIACLVDPDIIILDEVLSVGDGEFRKKSEKKMKEILSSGITGILVSHSVEQVRDVCNKVLWLDHGKQVLFTDDVALACDAYEGFLNKKKVPSTNEQIEQLAKEYQEKKIEEEAERKKRELQSKHLTEEQATLNLAIDVIKKMRPELLNKDLVENT